MELAGGERKRKEEGKGNTIDGPSAAARGKRGKSRFLSSPGGHLGKPSSPFIIVL